MMRLDHLIWTDIPKNGNKKNPYSIYSKDKVLSLIPHMALPINLLWPEP